MGAERINLTVLVDKSGSMGMYSDTPSKKSRWDDSFETAAGLVMCLGEYDDDGIDVVFFDRRYHPKSNVNKDNFPDLWASYSPGDGTYLAAPLKFAIDQALARRAGNPANKQELILVVTDGQPEDPDQVKQTIIDATHRMVSDDDLAILFLQSGTDRGATAFLKMLDDDLKTPQTTTSGGGLFGWGKKTTTKPGAKFDIVDVTTDQEIAELTPLEIIEKAFRD